MEYTYILVVVAVLSYSAPAFSQAVQRKLGEPVFLYTNGDHHWNHAFLTVQDRVNLVFSVKACHDARLILGTNFGATDNSIEIVLGTQFNEVSSIRYPFSAGEGLFETATPEILHCEEYRQFWVQWIADYIEVGHGNTVGNWKFMNYKDPNLFAVNTVGFSSGHGVAATWQLRENSGDLLEVITPEEYLYDTLWRSVKNRDMFIFQVRACADVHVILSQNMGEQHKDIYEISIGGWQNNQSVIRTNVYGGGGSIKATHLESNIVSCSDYREFYISWVNGSIRVGKSDLYPHRVFLRYDDPDPIEVNWVGITTGFGNTGTWLLNIDQETQNFIHSPPSNNTTPTAKYNTTWIESPKQHSIVFDLKTHEIASVLLGVDSSLAFEDEDVEIRIGEGANKDTICVGSVFQQGCLQTAQTTLSGDHYAPFWISWLNRTIHMGTGWFVGQNVLIKDVSIIYDFNALGFASTDWAWWRVRGYWGSRMLAATPPTNTNFQSYITWRTTFTKNEVMFQMKGDSDAHIALAETIGVSYVEKYYEVVIGGWNNQRTVIRLAVGDQQYEEISEVYDGAVLNENEFVDLWISWYHGLIEVGTGAVAGENRLIAHQFISLPVRALSFATWTSHYGQWKFYEDTGDYSLFYTNGTKNPKGWSADHFYLLYPGVNWTSFKVMSCKDANIYISSLEDDSNKIDRYQVTIGGSDNTKVTISHNGNPVAEQDFYELSCSNNKDFWLSWENAEIKVGRGYIRDFDTLLTANVEGAQYNISALGFGSPAGVSARWMVHERAAGDMEVYTTTNYEYLTWTTVEHRTAMFFAVNACSDAHILLSERLAKHHGFSYEIVIGGWNNSRTVIREWLEDEHGQRMPEHVIKDTPGIHNCSYPELFWISWENNFIAVGRGTTKERAQYIEYHPISLRPIRAMAFSTGYGFDGIYSIFFGSVFPTPPVEEVPATDGPGPIFDDGDDGLSGGAIAGIVIGVLSIVVIVGAIVFLALTYKGIVTTPSFLQTPSEGSGFSNPVSNDRSHEFSESQSVDA